MKAYIPFFALWTVALASSARAESTPAASPPAEDTSSVTAKTLSKQGHATTDVQASPDVQQQVGLGTEKQESKTTKTVAPAQAPEEKAKPKEAESDPYSHQMQFGVRAGFLLGYKMAFRYDKSPFCEKPEDKLTKKAGDQQKICGLFAPPALDVALSFAPIGSVEPYIWGRFGLSAESKTDTKPLRVFGAGARIYTAADSRFKFFFDPALGYEIEQGRGHAEWRYTSPPDNETFVPDYKKDLFFHLGFGPQYDFLRYAGVYLNLAANVSVLRGLNSTLEAQVGLQARAP